MTMTPSAASNPESATGLSEVSLRALQSPLADFKMPRPVDLHPAIQDVRRLPEFQPPPHDWMADLMKLPLFQQIQHALESVMQRLGQAFGKLVERLVPIGMSHLPQGIRDLLSSAALVVVVMLLLYMLYLILGWWLNRREGKTSSRPKSNRIFEQSRLVNSPFHFGRAQENARSGQFDEGIRQLYLAVLCVLDEQDVVPFEKTRSNLEYMAELRQALPKSPSVLMEREGKGLLAPFSTLATLFERSHYGRIPSSAQAFELGRDQYLQLVEQLTHRG